MISEGKKVNYLSLEEQNKFINDGYQDWGRVVELKHLKIFSEKAAHLLNRVIINAIDNGHNGIWRKCGAQVAFNQFNEVCIIFKKYDQISSSIRCTSNKNGILIKIKDKLANELKKFWKDYIKDRMDFTLKSYKGDEIINFDITFGEYWVLYEFLKDRNINSIIKKYGKKAFKSIIGEENKNQFLISTINTICAEIASITNEFKKDSEEVEDWYFKEIRHLQELKKDKTMVLESARDEKIKSLEMQLHLLKETNPIANPLPF